MIDLTEYKCCDEKMQQKKNGMLVINDEVCVCIVNDTEEPPTVCNGSITLSNVSYEPAGANQIKIIGTGVSAGLSNGCCALGIRLQTRRNTDVWTIYGNGSIGNPDVPNFVASIFSSTGVFPPGAYEVRAVCIDEELNPIVISNTLILTIS